MTCRIFHRWSEWKREYIECPGGAMKTNQARTRYCKRCPMTEEDYPRCVSASPAVLRLSWHYGEGRPA